ncbi:MAG: DegV family protein, partial [Oscillospiraceae bacterium]
HIDNGDEVVAVLLSSDMSGTYQSANIAKNEINSEKIVVIDSRQVTFALNLLVMEAKKLSDEGLSAVEIGEILNRKKEKIVFLGMVSTLEYLKKNGRLSGAAAVAGTLLNIKPFVTSKDGMIVQHSKMRGEKIAIEWLAKKAINEADSESAIINIGHGYCPEKAEILKSMLPQFENKLKIIFMGCSVGAHVGPGCVGVCYFKK